MSVMQNGKEKVFSVCPGKHNLLLFILKFALCLSVIDCHEMCA